MLNLTRRKTLLISGLIWFGIGLMLLTIGLRLLVETQLDTLATLLIVTALFLGWFKGKLVLRKTAKKTIERVKVLAEPISLKEAFGWPYLLLVLVMICFGVALRFFDPSIRGFVDVAVGSALIHGSITYFTYDKATP